MGSRLNKSLTIEPPVPKKASVNRTVKTRLSPAEREAQIVDGAIAYFSEVGFSGQTRELSARLGITQPLLYRYFSSKQALIDRVYKTVFEGRWNPQWLVLLQDRSIPLRDRLIEFYRHYSVATYRPDWIRIYMFAGLSSPSLNQRYIKLIRRELLPVMCLELRHCCHCESANEVSDDEMEFFWNLHGGIFYYAVREHVYQIRMPVPLMSKVEHAVDGFLAGAISTYPKVLLPLRGLPTGLPASRGSGLTRPPIKRSKTA
jgi:AcrR family transcriptional regulator